MPYSSYIYEVHAHHIFAANGFFNAEITVQVDGEEFDAKIGDLILDLYADPDLVATPETAAIIAPEAQSNKIGLFVEPDQIHDLQSLVDTGLFGASSHPGKPLEGTQFGHPIYDNMLVDEAAAIATTAMTHDFVIVTAKRS